MYSCLLPSGRPGTHHAFTTAWKKPKGFGLPNNHSYGMNNHWDQEKSPVFGHIEYSRRYRLKGFRSLLSALQGLGLPRNRGIFPRNGANGIENSYFTTNLPTRWLRVLILTWAAQIEIKSLTWKYYFLSFSMVRGQKKTESSLIMTGSSWMGTLWAIWNYFSNFWSLERTRNG